MTVSYQYTGHPYDDVRSAQQGVELGQVPSESGSGYSSKNAMKVLMTSPALLPADLPVGSAPPGGTTFAVGDGSSDHDAMTAGYHPAEPSPPMEGGIRITASLGTNSSGEIVAWDIQLEDDSAPDGLPITTSYQLGTASGDDAPSLDRSITYVDPLGVSFSGQTSSPGTWTRL